jgi:hypothetical protein
MYADISKATHRQTSLGVSVFTNEVGARAARLPLYPDTRLTQRIFQSRRLSFVFGILSSAKWLDSFAKA